MDDLSRAPASEQPQVRFVGPDTDWGRWPAVEPYFRALESRRVSSVAALEQWLLDASELQAALEEARNVREVAMTCQTDDPQRERAYLEFIETIVPAARRAWHGLDGVFLGCPHHAELPVGRYGVLVRRIRNRVELFREENVPLHTQDEKLRQRYQKTIGAMTVELDGREQTLEQAARSLELPDRPKRQESWELSWARRLRDRAALEDVYDEMLALRQRIARNAGCADYREYAFRELERFDYTPADCVEFHGSIERTAVPAYRGLHEERRRRLGLSPLRPWDLAVDPRGLEPLRPFEGVEELAEKGQRAFARVEADFGRQFERMRREGLLDLGSRKGKAPGGYMTVFELRRLPFIFMNAVGMHRDVETLLHEGGHAFHAFATRDEPLTAYRIAPIEFAEVASMGMELLASGMLDEFYSADDHRRARRELLEGIVGLLPWVATIDAFQHWLYTHAGHGRAERQSAWRAIRGRFAGLEDYGGHDEALGYYWQRQLHLFTVPFYYVEYGIAQLGALQVWQNSLSDFGGAVRAYRAALALGGGRPLPELFAAAGARFDFSEGVVGSVLGTVGGALRELGGAAPA